MSRFSISLGALLLLSTAPALGAQRAGVVLRLPASVRATGVGDAGAMSHDASALFYGPAGLDATTSASLNVGGWIGGSTFGALALASRWRGMAIGIGVRALDYGSADEIAPDASTGGTRGTPTGATISASEIALDAGVSRAFGILRAGVGVGYVRQSLVDATTDAVTASASVAATTHGWKWSVGALDASNGFRYGSRTEALGTTVRAGVRAPIWSALGAKWTSVAEVRSVAGSGQLFGAGTNAAWSTVSGWVLEARGGVTSHSSRTAQAPWSAGGSVGGVGFSLDYAYQDFGALGAVHRMGVTWRARSADAVSR